MLTTLAAMAGCDEIVVVVGAEAERVLPLLPSGMRSVVNPDHPSGMGSSLAAGLRAVFDTTSDVALVMLVDLPDVTTAVLDRLTELARGSEHAPQLLARAAYDGRPGHPVLIGRDHFTAVISDCVGDAGGRHYLRAQPVQLVECGDVGGGRDVDSPDQL
ncbi:CTP:molybdopterin cytidylyltransferase MocA [Nakamurella sp. UYEF19]